MIILYHREDCPFCWKVRLASFVCGMSYQEVLVGRGEKHPEVMRLNPRGTIPVMLHDELVLWESTVIVDYINEQFGQGKLLPHKPADRARLRSLQTYSDMIVGNALRDLIFEKRSKPEKDWNMDIIAEGARRWETCLDKLEGWSSNLDPHRFSIADCALLPRFALAAHYGHPVDARHPGLFAWFSTARKHSAYEKTRPGMVNIA
jgi:glutathione S-transferase